MSLIMPSRGLSVPLTEARLSRRRAYPNRYLVRLHSQHELVVARAPAGRQQELHRVGAHHAVAILPNASHTYATRPAAYPLHVPPDKRRRLAHPQPGVPHQAYHRNIQRATPTGARSTLQPTAPSPTRFVRRLPYGEVADQVQRKSPGRAGGAVSRQFFQHGPGDAVMDRCVESRVLELRDAADPTSAIGDIAPPTAGEYVSLYATLIVALKPKGGVSGIGWPIFTLMTLCQPESDRPLQGYRPRRGCRPLPGGP